MAQWERRKTLTLSRVAVLFELITRGRLAPPFGRDGNAAQRHQPTVHKRRRVGGLPQRFCLATCAVLVSFFCGLGAGAVQSLAADGPRMTDRELIEALDLDQPALARVKQTATANDPATALQALSAYYRSRTVVPWHVDPRRPERKHAFDKEIADAAVAGKVNVIGVWHAFPHGEIDWFFNATKDHPDMAYDAQWQLQMGRMSFWGDLSRAYAATGDEKYAQAWVRQLRGWIRQCPVPERSENHRVGYSAYLTLDVGIRMASAWPNAYHHFLLSPSFTDDDLVLYVKSCLEQARFLRKFATRGNWLTMEMNGLYAVGALFPEAREARDWREFAAGRLRSELQTQFLPDGAQIELTPGYHQVALGNILALAHTARTTGRLAELPAGYIAETERAYTYNLSLMTPDRSLPKFNDSWNVNVVDSLRKGLELFPRRQDFAWVASGGKDGRPPEPVSRRLPYAGYCAMRSGWEQDANYLAFDFGPLGYSHTHQDKLNVVVWAHGREVLFDCGGGNYEKSEWRAWAVDTPAHNTVLVDGKPQRRQTRNQDANVSRTPLESRWESTGAYDFAEGLYDEGYGQENQRLARHVRRVLFVKPDLFVVADALTPNDESPHTYQARWHLLPTQTRHDEASGLVETTAAKAPNLAVIPLLRKGLEIRSVSKQTKPEILGWHVQRYVQPQYVPATTVLHTRTGAGAQHFITLLVPLKSDASLSVQSSRALGGTRAEIELGDGRVWQVETEPRPAGGMQFDEILTGGAPGRCIAAPAPGGSTRAQLGR